MSEPRNTSTSSPLLEDASALLQFSKSCANQKDGGKEIKKEPSPERLPVVSHQNPGPAVAALSHISDIKSDHSMKAIVAAAALAAAALTPLPLTKSKKETAEENRKEQDKEFSSSVKPSKKPKELEAPKIGEPKQAQEPQPEESKQVEEPEQSEKIKQSEETENEDQAPSYAVDPDAGIIDCICKVNEDDGFTIQCDKCFRWQHALCFDISNDEVPDTYYCERCDAKGFEAKSIDVKRMREIQLNYFKKEGGRTKHSYDDHGSRKRYDSDGLKSEEATSKRRRVGSRERSILKENESPEKETKETRTKEKQQRKKRREEFDDHTNEELITRIESAREDYFYTVYYNLDQYEYRNKSVEEYATKVLPRLLSEASKQSKSNLNVVNLSDEEYNNLDTTAVKVRNILLSENGLSSSNYKFSGLSNMGVFVQDDVDKGQLIKEFYGELDYQDNFFKNSLNQFRYWGLPKNYYLFINYFKKSKSDDTSNPYSHENVSNLAVSLENYLAATAAGRSDSELLVPLYLNCKTSGNVLRFVRKACYPNCQLVPVLVRGKTDSVKFFLQALRPIEKGSELTIGWEFDFNKLFSKLYLADTIDIDKHNDLVKANFSNELTNFEKVQLINQVEFILSQYKCGCYSVSSNVNNVKCKLLRVKKMGSYFYRSSRKGSKLSKLAEGVRDSETKPENNLIRNRLVHRDTNVQKLLTQGTVVPARVSTSDNNTVGGGEQGNNEDPFTKVQKRKELYEHPKRKYLFTKAGLNYSIVNSRNQLTKAIIANSLFVPIPVKTIDVSLLVLGDLSKPMVLEGIQASSLVAAANLNAALNVNSLGRADKLADKLDKLATEAPMVEVKKVKKMSFADFLKNRAG